MHALLDAIAAMARPLDACRIFHGRGGLHAGCEQWSLDAYPPVFLLTSHAPAAEEDLQRVGEALARRWAQLAPDEPLNWVFQHRDEVRAHNELRAGSVPEEHVVTEAGLRFQVHLMRGLNHGFFLDMAEGRRWVRQWAATQPRGRVLNLFAYTCAFSVAALAGGAHEVTNVDMARGPLAIGKRNHLLNGLGQGAAFLPHDVFHSWGKLKRGGPYDLVVLDPPSFQKGSFVATKDYARLVRKLPELLAPDGHALLCLNTPKLGPDFLAGLVASEAPGLHVVERLANPAAFADADPARALKVVVCRRPPGPAAPATAA